MEQWEGWQQRKWNLQQAEYDNKKAELKQNQDEGQLIAQQKKLVNSLIKDLEELIKDLEVLINEYNQEINKPCPTKSCEKARLVKKDKITTQKEKALENDKIINNKVSAINQKQKEYDQKQKQYSEELDAISKKMTAFSENWLIDRAQKNKDYEKAINKERQKAKNKWLLAKKSLSESKKAFYTDYGENFVSLRSWFSHWMSAVQPIFTALAKKSASSQEEEILRTANTNFCAKNKAVAHPEDFSQRARICDRARKMLISLSAFLAVPDKNKPLQEDLNKKNQEIQNKEQAIKQFGAKIDATQAFVSSQKKKYQEQQTKKQEQLRALSKTLQEDLNRQIQIRKKAYENKIHLLEKEYDLIHTLLFVKHAPKDLISELTNDFELARVSFLKSKKIKIFLPCLKGGLMSFLMLY